MRVVDYNYPDGREDQPLLARTGQSILEALISEAHAQLDFRRHEVAQAKAAAETAESSPELKWRVGRWLADEDQAREHAALLPKSDSNAGDIVVIRGEHRA